MPRVYWRGGALLSPVPPVMVSCGNMEKSNIVTVAWCGLLSTHPPKTYISLRPERYSYGIIRDSGEFVINLTSADMVRHADYCGMYTGRKVDKFAATGLTKESANKLSCPAIGESPMTLECRVTDIVKSGSHDIFIADIVSVGADCSLLDSDGKLHMERAHLAAFAHGEYFELGRRLGTFGFSVRKKKKRVGQSASRRGR